MKKTFLIINLFLSLILFAQKPVDQKELVKSYVIKQTMASLEFPKYYKTEKTTIFLTQDTIQVGVNKANPCDLKNVPKYLTIDEDIIEDNLEKFKAYKIDSILPVVISNKVIDSTVIIYHKDADNQNQLFYYQPNDSIHKFFKSYKNSFVKFYKVSIWYWAMSKSGTVRLYNDKGNAFIDNKNRINYFIRNGTEE